MMRFKLRELLERPGSPSQAQLARSVGMPRQQINRLVNGDVTRIDLRTLDRVYRALDLGSVEELIEYVPENLGRSSFREWFIAQLVALTLSPVQRDPGDIYREPSVRQAAEEFFDRHISRDLQRGGVLAGLHARLMGQMRDFVHRHGARTDTDAVGDEELEKLVSQIPVEELSRSN
ncbi:helix-turn-helix domain-containing protein [Candidatus Latescibacterota bacterium]